MKIALIIYGSLDIITGGYIYDKYIVEYLKNKDCEIKIFSQPNSHFINLIKNNFSKALLSELIEFSPDLILQDQMNFISLFLLNKKIKKNLKVPIISIVNAINSKVLSFKNSKMNNFFLEYIIKKIEKNYLINVDSFIFNSYSTYKEVNNIINKNCNYVITYPGKDRLGLIKNKKSNFNSDLKILFAGNLTYGKGLHLLLNALAKLDSNNWSLSVAGNTQYDLSYTKNIKSIIDRKKLVNKVKLLGCLTAEEIKAQMLEHDILAVPSYYESYGMVYAEAMSAGLPVIACLTGGVPEIIQHNINGYLIKPGDHETLSKYLVNLTKDRELLKQMSHSAITKYKNMLTWEESMQSIFEFLTILGPHNLAK